jgi:hypothetical protein
VASPKAKMPPSEATSQYPLPVGVAAMPTSGRARSVPPVDPRNGASPNAMTSSSWSAACAAAGAAQPSEPASTTPTMAPVSRREADRALTRDLQRRAQQLRLRPVNHRRAVLTRAFVAPRPAGGGPHGRTGRRTAPPAHRIAAPSRSAGTPDRGRRRGPPARRRRRHLRPAARPARRGAGDLTGSPSCSPRPLLVRRRRVEEGLLGDARAGRGRRGGGRRRVGRLRVPLLGSALLSMAADAGDPP